MRVALAIVFTLILTVALLAFSPAYAGDDPCPAGAQLVRGVPEDPEFASSLGVREAQWCERDGRKDGPYRDYYADGALFRTMVFVAGKRNGPSVSYFRSGSKWRESTYLEGRSIGRSTAWNENGRIVEVTDYEIRGKDLLGRFKSWYPDGRPLAEGELLNDALHGRMTFFDDRGVMWVEQYEHGKRVSGVRVP